MHVRFEVQVRHAEGTRGGGRVKQNQKAGVGKEIQEQRTNDKVPSAG